MSPIQRAYFIGTGTRVAWFARALAGALVAATTRCAAASAIEWQDLRPAPQAGADNPFDALSDEQVEALRRLVVSRELEARGLPPSAAPLQQRAELTRQLAAQGVDAEALLARRAQMIAQRRADAESAVAALDGRAVRLAGYLVPTASGSDGGITEFLLVPWVGACSHAERPPANQVVHVRPAQPYPGRGGYYEPVTVDGALRLRTESTPVFLGDGTVPVRSAYALDRAVVAPTPAAPRF
jgi:hypothetical protein